MQSISNMKWLCILFLAVTLWGCQGKKSVDQQAGTSEKTSIETFDEKEEALPGYPSIQQMKEADIALGDVGFDVCENTPVPDYLPLPEHVPADIPGYMRSLVEKRVAKPVVRFPENGDKIHISRTLNMLQDYATGKRVYYPQPEVVEAIRILYGYHHYDSGHNGEDYPNPELRLVQNYLYQFAAIAARLCPNLDFISDVKDADATLGLLQFMDWGNTCVTQSFVFIPDGRGLKMQILDELDAGHIRKIFCLKDEKGREYYLFSNDDDAARFTQVLCMKRRSKLVPVQTFTGLYGLEPSSEYTILFNPRTLSWNFRERKGVEYHKIEETATVKLHLDGMHSRFEIEK